MAILYSAAWKKRRGPCRRTRCDAQPPASGGGRLLVAVFIIALAVGVLDRASRPHFDLVDAATPTSGANR
jgi:hypothetical protein